MLCLTVLLLCLGAVGAASAQTVTLGTNSLTFGNSSGAGTVVIGPGGAWTASTTAPWVHISRPSGRGGDLFTFTYDANSGATRSGTISFNSGAAALSVTQAGSSYTAAREAKTLVSSGLNSPGELAVDPAGDLYILDLAGESIKKWTAATGQLTLLVSSGLNGAYNIALDSAGNVYIADHDGIKRWAAATGRLALLVSGLSAPNLFGLDAVGNVYFSSLYNGTQEWIAASGEVKTLLPSVNGLGGVVDYAGNVYFLCGGCYPIGVQKRTATTGEITLVVNLGADNIPESFPSGLKVDVAGNLYLLYGQGSFSGQSIQEWSAATEQATSLLSLSSGLSAPWYYANPDRFGNLYITYLGPGVNQIRKFTRAFVGPPAFAEPLTSGVDQLFPVLPASTPLDAASDESWLKITSQTGGVVSFSFSAAPETRTGHIALLGQKIAVTQVAPEPPTVVSSWVLWGAETYSLTGSTRNRLPWQITGIRVLFSEPIAIGDVSSLSGVTATALSGLGTNTLTWTIEPVSLGSFNLVLAQSGPHALRDVAGNLLAGNGSQMLKVLWGDFNDDGVVNAADLTGVNLARTTFYNLFADLNGDNSVDALDMQIVRSRIGSILP